MRRLLTVAAVVISLAGCSESAPASGQPTVTYEIAGGIVRCPNANDTSNFSSGSYQSFSCVWLCATYKGQPSRYVDLTFVGSGSTWVLDSEYVAAGICY